MAGLQLDTNDEREDVVGYIAERKTSKLYNLVLLHIFIVKIHCNIAMSEKGTRIQNRSSSV